MRVGGAGGGGVRAVTGFVSCFVFDYFRGSGASCTALPLKTKAEGKV